jgi:hypothetical protein
MNQLGKLVFLILVMEKWAEKNIITIHDFRGKKLEFKRRQRA